MREPWTTEEIKILARGYFQVLRAELVGERTNKNEALRTAQTALPHRTLHTLKDRCYRISEVLDEHGLPWVQGWKPPALVGQTPNSPGVSDVIWRAVEPMLPRELPV